MSAIATGRGKWVTYQPLTTFAGTKVTADTFPASVAIPAWASGETYDINQVVSAASKQWKCRVTHNSGDGTGGTVATPTATNRHWREVPDNTVISLRNFTFNRGTSQQTATDLSEDQDPKIATELTGSAALEFNYLYDDLVQESFVAGSSGICKVYRAGIGAGKPVIEFNCDVSNESFTIGNEAQSSTLTLDMDGPPVYSKQA